MTKNSFKKIVVTEGPTKAMNFIPIHTNVSLIKWLFSVLEYTQSAKISKSHVLQSSRREVVLVSKASC